jgi:hypothetical protein
MNEEEFLKEHPSLKGKIIDKQKVKEVIEKISGELWIPVSDLSSQLDNRTLIEFENRLKKELGLE